MGIIFQVSRSLKALFLFLAEMLGNSEALWVKFLREVPTARPVAGVSQYLANLLRSPLVVDRPSATHHSRIFRPVAGDEVIGGPHESGCFSCGRESVEMAPRFSGCPGAISSGITWIRPAPKSRGFRCGQYCWECLRNALSQARLERNAAFPYRCPACSSALPIWALKYVFEIQVLPNGESLYYLLISMNSVKSAILSHILL